MQGIKKIVIGIHIGHDSSACLVLDGKIVYAEEEERLNKIKNYFGFPTNILNQIISNYNIDRNRQINIAIAWDINEYISRREEYIKTANQNGFHAWANRRSHHLKTKLELLDMTSKIFPKAQIHYIPHHFSHAMSVIPFIEGEKVQSFAAIISDAIAEGDSLTLFNDVLFKDIAFSADLFECSLGYFYQRWAEVLGFNGRQSPGYLMSLVGIAEDEKINGLFEKNLISYRNKWPILNSKTFNPIKGIGPDAYKCFDEKFLQIINFDASIQNYTYKAVFASATQHVLEKIILGQIEVLRSLTKTESIILSGGVFHNCLLVDKIKNEGLFKNVYIGPASKDSGTSIGAATSCYYLLNNRLPDSKATPYLGYNIDDSISNEMYDVLSPFIEFKSEKNILDSIVDDIHQNKILGISTDKLEFGPRALGNRSIIGRVDSDEIRYKINSIIKKRYDFQPLAAVMLKNDAKDYININTADHMMTGLALLNPNNTVNFKGVLHVKNTCRMQIIEENSNLFISKVLIRMRQMRYLPSLINTSFNLKGEPLVRDINDAIITYLKSEIDCLYTRKFSLKVPMDKRQIILNKINKVLL